MPKVLITGAKGFIGSALSAELIKRGFEVEEADLPGFDVTGKDPFRPYLTRRFDRVFHLAARTFVPDSWKTPADFYRVNTSGTMNALEYCRSTGTPLTYVSAYVYGVPDRLPINESAPVRPNNPYAHSKFLAEEACRFYAGHYGLPVVILRPFNVYGPGQSGHFLIPMIVRQAVRSGEIRLRELTSRRDYVHLDDVVRALALTMKKRRGLHIYNIGSGASLSVRRIVDAVCRFTGGKKIVSLNERRKEEIRDTVACVALAGKELGWKPRVKFSDGIGDLVRRESDPETMPINKGNYSMETAAREAEFERKRGAGWEDEYAAYRRNWIDFPKAHFVPEYPLLVDLELSSVCNLRCPMCYTITEEFKRKVRAGLMDYALFTRIVDEIAGKVPALRLSLRGEPTLHPKFMQCVGYAREKGIKEISFLTNGSTLTLDNFRKMAAAGADWITVSVDGLGAAYESIRRPLKSADTLKKLKDIQMYKERRGLPRPVVKVQSVWPAIKADPEGFYNALAPYCDLVAFNPLIDYLGKDTEISYDEDFVCPQHYQRLVIGSDGRAMMCSNDEECTVPVGDAGKETIYDIWHGPILERLRRKHLEKCGFRKIPVCAKCYLPRSTDDTEAASVNGRTFIVRNYAGRAQKIGG